ncbi:hypothetical protein CARUB_v10003747mg [Capsella rubella]|uniref:(S)-ureidoglycine aminohydrolase cupin domain-containing protein n=1 Tax=Capsella rubella TaxID=81985 RepID=R0HD99_9BRAS|nr:uncharacterized protein LOC17883031 [Capsella rubella]EOA23000.1 hypothetical protein CARUB_v10003747mg [Capsella rubella]
MELNRDSSFALAVSTEIHGIKIFKQTPDAKLAELGVASWPLRESNPRKFPWQFKKTETMYFAKGKLKVNIEEHHKEGEALELKAGDLVVFPKDMKVFVDVTEDVKKHYYRESEIDESELP